jgi:hypothetical protein
MSGEDVRTQERPIGTTHSPSVAASGMWLMQAVALALAAQLLLVFYARVARRTT